MRALIIKEPYINYVISGEKTWEMRSKKTNIRGEIGLIKKGTGLIVGVANLVESLPAISAAEMEKFQKFHKIDSNEISSAIKGNWVHPWVLSNVRRLKMPISYSHPKGAVIWVTLDDDITRAVLSSL